jgi:hypothetical protein
MQFTNTVAQQPHTTLPQSTPSLIPQHTPLAQLNALDLVNMLTNLMQSASNSSSDPSLPK